MPARNELVARGNAVGLTASNYPNDSKFEQKILYMEKFGTAYTETLGVGTLTQSGPAANGDQITVGNRTYTFVTNLSGVKASSTLTNATSFSDGETVTIDGVQYVFKTTLTNSASNEVLIGANVAASLTNLKKAITDAGTIATHYSTGTVAHPTVTATTLTGTTLLVVAKTFGTGPNSFVTAETGATASWTGTTLSGGTANVPDEIKLTGVAATELDMLKDAINNGAIAGVEGTDYSFGTYAHTQVTATTNGATTQVVASRNGAFDNASIATTDPVDGGSVFSWGATTLASGVRGAIAANTTTYGGSAGISGDKNVV
jgi:hypothetical protein